MTQNAVPPVAKQVPTQRTVHGHVLTDEYAWLRDREDPDTLAYLEAENAYTEAATADQKGLRDRIVTELRSRMKEDDTSVPVRIDDHWYYAREEEGKQYPIYCRRTGNPEAPEEVLLDANVLAEGLEYFALGTYAISPDHRLLAYATESDGSEKFTLVVKDLETGEFLSDVIHGTYYGAAWAEDGRSLFYTTLDENHRPYRVHRHHLGEAEAKDEVVYQESDPSFFVSVTKTRSRKFLVITCNSHTTSEEWLVPADRPDEEPRLVRGRKNGVEYSLAHHVGRFFVTTNEDAKDFKVMTAAEDDPGTWEEFLPHRPGTKIDGVDCFRDHLVIHQRTGGITGLEVHRVADGSSHRITFPEPVHTVGGGNNPMFGSRSYRLSYESPVTPSSVYDYDLETRDRVLRKQLEIPGGYDPTRYRCTRLEATAPDGTRIPLSLLHRRDVTHDGRHPCVLYGYGAYGMSIDPRFNPNRFSLIDRGFVFAIAHIRGGGSMGRTWYEAGKLEHKTNTFTDFIAAAEHLVAEKWTHPDRLAAMGGSAGGMLMGTVANQRPDLFRAIVAQVPFVDVVNTMLDETLPLTVIEYEEWGNPADPAVFQRLLGYSPYDNVRAGEYPHMLVTAGLNDPRVTYWEPAKWVARIRARKTDGNLLLLKTEMGQGHGGASGRYDRLEEIAFEYAFLIRAVGASDDPLPPPAQPGG